MATFPPVSGIWGEHQNIERLVEGVCLVDTPSHGGVVMTLAAAREFMSKKAIKYVAQRQGNLFWFEEDCAIGAVMYEHPDWFTSRYVFSPGMTVQKTKESGEASLRRHYPEYFK